MASIISLLQNGRQYITFSLFDLTRRKPIEISPVDLIKEINPANAAILAVYPDRQTNLRNEFMKQTFALSNVRRHFESWSGALRAAGIKQAPRNGYQAV
jgi:hypothetical protein